MLAVVLKDYGVRGEPGLPPPLMGTPQASSSSLQPLLWNFENGDTVCMVLETPGILELLRGCDNLGQSST